MVHNVGTMAIARETPLILNFSINPLQAMVLPGLSSRDASLALRKYCFLGFHPDLDCSVYSNLVVITMGDVPAFAKIGPENRGCDERL